MVGIYAGCKKGGGADSLDSLPVEHSPAPWWVSVAVTAPLACDITCDAAPAPMRGCLRVPQLELARPTFATDHQLCFAASINPSIHPIAAHPTIATTH